MQNKRLVAVLLIAAMTLFYAIPFTYAQEAAEDIIISDDFSGGIDESVWSTVKNPTTSADIGRSEHGEAAESYYIPGGVLGGAEQYIENSFGVRRAYAELYFYDTLSEEQNSSFGVAVSDNLIFGLYAEQTNYSVKSGGTWLATDAVRSEGWHKLVFDTMNQNELKIYLDDNEIFAGNEKISCLKIGNFWNLSGWDEWYVDDVRVTAIHEEAWIDRFNSETGESEAFYEFLEKNGFDALYGKMPQCDKTEIVTLLDEGKPYEAEAEVKEKYERCVKCVMQYDDSVYQAELTEDFGNGIDTDVWTLDGKAEVKNGGDDVFGGGAYVYDLPVSGTENKCLVTSGSKLSRSGSILHELADGKYRITVYFYDNLKNNPGAYSVRVSDNYKVGIYGTSGAYVSQIGDSVNALSVKRSEGWHKIVFDNVNQNSLRVYIDGEQVYEDAQAEIEYLQIGTLDTFDSYSWFSTDNITIVRKFAPTVSDVKLTGDKKSLTVSYSYSHEKSVPEGDTKIVWYKKNEDGEFSEISGAEGKTYYYSFPGDTGATFRAAVRPADENGIEGEEVMSGEYTENYMSSVMPVVTSIKITGDAYAGSVLTAEYTAEKAGGEDAGQDKYKWYISGDGVNYTEIEGQTSRSLTLGVDEIGAYIKAAVSVAGREGSYSEWTAAEPVADTTTKIQMINAVKSLSDVGKNKRMTELLMKMDSSFSGYSSKLREKIVSALIKSTVTSEAEYDNIVKTAMSDTSDNTPGGSASIKTDKISKTDSDAVKPLVSNSGQSTAREYVKFKDLDSVSWAVEAIEALTDKGILSGREENRFCPNDNVTRAEFVKMIVSAFYTVDTTATPGYDDVAEDAWCAPYIATARKNKIVYGKDNGEFGINDFITREEMAVICSRIIAAGLCDKEEVREYTGFDDENNISEYAHDAVVMMYTRGIINGVDNNMFGAKSNATRAMAAKIIYEMVREPEPLLTAQTKVLEAVKEDFEDGLGSFIGGHPTDTTGAALTTSSAQAYNGSSSLEIKGRGFAYTKAGDNKVFRVMFYDDAAATDTSAVMIAGDYILGFTCTSGGPSKTEYVYRQASDWASTGIERSTGWHEFIIDFSNEGRVDLYIDGGRVKSYTANVSKIDNVILCNSWNDTGKTAAYADAFVMAQNMESLKSSVGEVNVGGNALINDTELSLENVPQAMLEPVGLLNALNILPADGDGNIDLDSAVSREELAYYLIGMTNESAAYKTAEEQKFSDVDKSGRFAGYINRAADMGLMSGTGGESFSPKSDATVIEAVKALLKLLGYSALSDTFGEDDTKWLSQADNIGLLDGAAESGVLTRGTAVRLMFNALHTNMYVVDGVLNNFLQYTKSDDILLMNYYFDVYYTRDYVNGIYGTELDGGSTLRENTIKIGNLSVANYKYNMSALNGMDVKAYIYAGGHEGDSYVLVYAQDSGKSRMREIAAEDIESVSEGRFLYYEGDDIKTVRFNSDIKVIYNNSYLFGYTEENLKPEIGYVRFVDRDLDGVYDIAFVMDYKPVLVESNDVYANVITDKYTGTQFDLSDGDTVTCGNSKPASLEGISAGKIILLAVSEDGRRADFIRCDGSISGRITKTSGDEVYIDDTAYRLSKTVEEYMERNNTNPFKIGSTGTYYTDGFGNIVGASGVSMGSEKFGYYINSWLDDAGEKLSVKLYTEDGKIITYICKDKIKVGDNTVSSIGNKELIGLEPQLIMYKLSGDELSSIRFADTANQGSETLKGSDEFWLYREAEQWHRIGYGFGKYMNVTSDTKVMLVPDKEQIKSEKGFGIVNSSYFTEGLVVRYKAYNADKFNVPQIVLVVGSAYHPDEILKSTTMFVFDELAEEVDENGDLANYVRGYVMGEEKSYRLEDGVDINACKAALGYEKPLERGDAILFWINSDDEVYNIGQIVHAAEDGAKYTDLSAWNLIIDKLSCCYAMIDEYGSVAVRITDGTNICVIKNPKSITVVNRTTGNIRKGTEGDLVPGRDAAIRTYNGVTTDMVVYVD